MAVSFHPPPRRILVRGVNWLGDAVMTTPALLRLRERFAGANITLLTPAKLRDLWQPHPAVDDVIGFEAGEGLFFVGRKLRAGKFDLALVLPNSPRSAMETWLAGIPQRVGYARPWRSWLLTRAVPKRPGHGVMQKRSVAEIRDLIASSRVKGGNTVPIDRSRRPAATAHQLHEYLHLVATVGASEEPTPPALSVSPAEVEAVKHKFGLLERLTAGRPCFGLNPGAEYGPAKRWPVTRFIAAAREVQQRTNCVWLILGGKSDIALADEICSALRPPPTACHNLAGQTSLRELMALLKLCRMLLANDTGPMHVAAALGTPVVVPFGSTSPELTGPGLPGDPRHRLLKSDAPCAPCFLRECPIDFRCLNGISSDQAVRAVIEAMQKP
jgi:heptosyltransferase-2